MLHVRGTDDFFRDAEAGTLPAFSLVDPDFRAYSEENPQDIQKGESFASAVINAVMHGQGWMNTLLIWVYDEHGGYYDHVPPPPAVPPDDVPGRSVTASRSWLGDCCGVRPRLCPRTPSSWTPGRRAMTATASGCPRCWSPRTPGRITSPARPTTTPRSSSWSRRSGTCPRSPRRDAAAAVPARRAGLHRPAGLRGAAGAARARAALGLLDRGDLSLRTAGPESKGTLRDGCHHAGGQRGPGRAGQTALRRDAGGGRDARHRAVHPCDLRRGRGRADAGRHRPPAA